MNHLSRSVFGSASNLFPTSLAGESLLESFLFARFQIEGVFLDFLNDVFLLDFSLEATESVLNRLTLLNSYFSHVYTPPNLLLNTDHYYPALVARKSIRWACSARFHHNASRFDSSAYE